MELRSADSNDVLVLEPTRYEFPDLVGVAYDSDWLVVYGEARFGGEEWRWAQPSLLVAEADRLVDWLAELARTGRAEPLAFIEPNLGFDVASSDVEFVELVVSFGHESAPPSRVGDDRYAPVPLRLRVRRDDLAAAALDLEEVMHRFPSRA